MPVAVMDKMMATTTPEEREAGMGEWRQWMKDHREDFADMGAPLGKTKRVSAAGVEDVRNEMAGYSIVQANSHEEAAQMLSDSPHLKMEGATIDVMNIGEVPPM